MSPLESRYRRLLRVLPVDYRRDWQEDMVETFLDADEAQRHHEPGEEELTGLGHPGAGEVAAVTALAVRLRVGAPATVGASARSLAWGEAVRRVALLGLLVPSALVVASMLGAVGYRLVGGPVPGAAASTTAVFVDGFVPEIGWVLAYLALAGGWRAAARVLAPVTWVAVVVSWSLAAVAGDVVAAGALVVGAVALAVPVAALVGWHSDAGPPSRWWLAALPVVVVGLVVVSVPAYLGLPVLWDLPGLLCLVVVVAAVAVRVLAGRREVDVHAWLLALAVLAPIAALWRAVLVVELLQVLDVQPELGLLVVTSAAQLVATVVVTVTASSFARRRRSGPARPSGSSPA